MVCVRVRACTCVCVRACVYYGELVPLTLSRVSNTPYFPAGWLAIYIHEPLKKWFYYLCECLCEHAHAHIRLLLSISRPLIKFQQLPNLTAGICDLWVSDLQHLRQTLFCWSFYLFSWTTIQLSSAGRRQASAREHDDPVDESIQLLCPTDGLWFSIVKLDFSRIPPDGGLLYSLKTVQSGVKVSPVVWNRVTAVERRWVSRWVLSSCC